MDSDNFKQIETLMELDARHDAILASLEELDKQIEEAIRSAQETATTETEESLNDVVSSDFRAFSDGVVLNVKRF